MTGAIEIFPTTAIFYNCLQVFQPDHTILYRVLDDCSCKACCQITSPQCAIAIIASHSQTAIDDRDSLCGRKCSTWGFDLCFAIRGNTIAQLAENGHYAADLLQSWLLSWQLERFPQAGNTSIDNINLFLYGVRQRKDN